VCASVSNRFVGMECAGTAVVVHTMQEDLAARPPKGRLVTATEAASTSRGYHPILSSRAFAKPCQKQGLQPGLDRWVLK
jgi:hypothetical protein